MNFLYFLKNIFSIKKPYFSNLKYKEWLLKEESNTDMSEVLLDQLSGESENWYSANDGKRLLQVNKSSFKFMKDKSGESSLIVNKAWVEWK
jgi:hypothetical protein